jgi:hypothetical protein
MGKKSKNKKNRKNQQAQVIRPQVMAIAEQPSPSTPMATVTDRPKPSSNGVISDNYVRKDILRISILLGIIVIILAALVVVNDKTTKLQSAGRKLATFLQLQ